MPSLRNWYKYVHFSDEETEVWRDQTIYLRGRLVAEGSVLSAWSITSPCLLVQEVTSESRQRTEVICGQRGNKQNPMEEGRRCLWVGDVWVPNTE